MFIPGLKRSAGYTECHVQRYSCQKQNGERAQVPFYNPYNKKGSGGQSADQENPPYIQQIIRPVQPFHSAKQQFRFSRHKHPEVRKNRTIRKCRYPTLSVHC